MNRRIKHGKGRRNRPPIKRVKVLVDNVLLDELGKFSIRKVRVIDENGQNLGLMRPNDGFKLAQEKDLNFFCPTLKGNEPVCKILDYGKYRFEEQKKERLSNKKQTKIVVKEYRISINTSDHDISYRVDSIKEALKKGQHIKLAVKLFGRFLGIEGAGFDIIERICEQLGEEMIIVEKPPVRNNRYVEVHFAPSKAILQKLKLSQQVQKKEKEKEQKLKNSNKINVKEEEIQGV